MISILNKKIYFLILTFLLIFLIPTTNAETEKKQIVNIYFFHSNECSHCKDENKFLNYLENKYNNIHIYKYEVHDNNNNNLKNEIQKLYQIKTNGVPITIIGDTPYIGFSEEKSKITFIKTIEYYSKYGYIDKTGEFLKIATLNKIPPQKTAPSLEEFIDTYGNYKLIGSIYTNKLDTTAISIILGLLSQINIFKITSLLIIGLLLIKNKNKIQLFSLYLLLTIILKITKISENNIYEIIINIAILIAIIITLLNYLKTKRKSSIEIMTLLIASITTNYIETILFNENTIVFKKIIELNSLTGILKINYYANYIFILILINLIYIAIFMTIKTNKKAIEN